MTSSQEKNSLKWGISVLSSFVFIIFKVVKLFSSVQFSRSIMYNSLQTHEPQHTRPPCPSPTPRVHPNPWPLSQWCHPTTSSSVIPFSSCPQSFPESGSFQMSQFFASGGKVLEFKPAHKWSNDFQQRTKVIQWGKNNFATNGARIIEYSYVRM